MPELPEVETVVLGLRKLLPSKQIVGLKFDWPKSYQASQADTEQFVFSSRIIDVRRRGKAIIIDLSSDYSLVIHLKMTGQLVYRGEEDFAAGHPSDSFLGELPDKSTRVQFELNDGHQLFFNDQRKFGWVKLIPTHAVNQINFIQKLGPDALKISPKDFIDRFSSRKKSVKACLLDQTIVAGCGNIYADEALWMSQIHPQTKANQLSRQQLKDLHKNLQDILKLSLGLGGSTSRNYVDAEGRKGSYLDFANVYSRHNQPCKRCSEPIQKIKVAGRGSHICQQCQPE